MPGKAYSPGIVVLQHVYIGTLQGQGVAACIVPSTIHWKIGFSKEGWDLSS